MTRLTKPVRREVHSPRGVLVVELAESGITIRRKRSHKVLGPVTFGAIEDLAAKMDAAARGHAVPSRRIRSRT